MAERSDSLCGDDQMPLDPELVIKEKNVLDRLARFSRDKWHELGIVLDVPKVKLNTIAANHRQDVSRCFVEVITYWINNGEVTWTVLWEALCHDNVAAANLGREIRDWYWKKTLKDPRQDIRPSKRTYIQLPGRSRQLRAVKCSVDATGLSDIPESKGYFRVEPIARPPSPPDRIYQGHLVDMKSQLKYYLKSIEPHQKRFKVGYEARFGQLYWQLPDDSDMRADTMAFSRKKPQNFSPHVTCDIRRLTSERCHPSLKDHQSLLVDPLKFVVDLPAHKGVVYVAVVSRAADLFVLHEVYQQQERQVRTIFDIVQPQRKYDIRLGDCCALTSKADDDKVRLIAVKITGSIHIEDENGGKLMMQLVGEDFHVKFLRYKKQQVYRWKGKEKQKWYLAEYDVDSFEMTDKLLQTIRAKAFSSGHYECSDVPLGGHRKEIELWSRKIFPEGYSNSHPTSRLYIDPEATGPVRMPNTPQQSATKWTAEELIEDIDDFVQAAFDITSFLEHS